MAFALFGAQALTASAAGEPTITAALAPATGSIAGGDMVTVTGTNFTGTTAVSFGGSPGTAITVNGAGTSLTVTSPGHASGIVDVIVTNAVASSVPDANSKFSYTAATPTVTGLNPTSGTTAGGTLVQISGTGFDDVAASGAVKFDTTVAIYTKVSDTQIQALSPAHAAGAIDVTVTASGGASTTSAASKYTYNTPQPVITSLAPSGGPIEGGTAVTINGSGFTGATQVTFGGFPLAVPAVHTDTAITVSSPAHTAGTVDVSVTTPVGTSANTAADNFTYGAGPVVTSVSPTTGGIAGGAIITVTGTGLMGATSVSVGGTAVVPTNVTDTSLTVVAPAHAAGVVDIIVTTPTGVSANTASDNFAYSAAPFVTAITPTGGPVTGGTLVTITGSGLTGATAVNFGATSVVPVVTNDTTITAVAPAHAAVGTVDVIVTTPLGISMNTAADNYTYGNLAVITGVNPTTGPIAGGTTVTLTGTGFTGATLVTFGGVTAVPTNVTDTSLTVVTPAQAAGEVNIFVTTPVGISAANAAATFEYGSASTTSYTLYFRWSLIVWNGANNVDIMAALKGQETPDNTATNDISSQVTAIFRYNNALQKFEAFFPGTSNVPGANDFTVFNTGRAYWIAIAGPNSITWTIIAG